MRESCGCARCVTALSTIHLKGNPYIPFALRPRKGRSEADNEQIPYSSQPLSPNDPVSSTAAIRILMPNHETNHLTASCRPSAKCCWSCLGTVPSFRALAKRLRVAACIAMIFPSLAVRAVQGAEPPDAKAGHSAMPPDNRATIPATTGTNVRPTHPWPSESDSLAPTGQEHHPPLKTILSRPMTIGEALQMTLHSSAEILVRRQDTYLASQEFEIERAAFDPTFKFHYDHQYGMQPSEMLQHRPTDRWPTANAEFLLSQKSTWGTQLDVAGNWVYSRPLQGQSLLSPLHASLLSATLTQPLLRGAGVFANSARMEIAARYTEISAMRFRRLVREVLRETEANYWDFYLRHQNWKDQDRSYATARHLEGIATAKFKLGLLSELDLARAKGESARRLVNLTEAKNAAIEAEYKLKGITNSEQPSSGPDVFWIPMERPTPQKAQFKIDEEVFRGLQHRADFQAAVLDLRAQRVRVDLALNHLQPILNVVGGVKSVGLAGDDGGVTNGAGQAVVSPYVGDIGDMFEHMFWQDGIVWNVGIVIEFPFYMRKDRAEARKRYAVAKQAFSRLVRAERSVIREVREAIQIADTTYLKVAQAQKNRSAAQIVYEKTWFQLTHGLTDVKRVVDALDELAESRILENRTTTEYLNALTRLELATGTYLLNRGIYLDPYDNHVELPDLLDYLSADLPVSSLSSMPQDAANGPRPHSIPAVDSGDLLSAVPESTPHSLSRAPAGPSRAPVGPSATAVPMSPVEATVTSMPNFAEPLTLVTEPTVLRPGAE